MKRWIVAVLLVAASIGAQAQDLKKLKEYIENARKAWNVPGVAIAIVKDDKVVMSEGFGVLEEGKADKVDGNSMFAIASNSKAYTATCLAMLVDEGKISWDDKVTTYLPWFKLYDPFVTEQMTIRDLLCHRTGLATFSGDLIWYGSNHSREEVVRKAQYLKPVYGFREKWGYSNIMFLAAGLIVEKVSGLTWDQFVQQRIFNPLGMNRAITSTNQLAGLKNVAIPHNEVEGKNVPIEYLNWDNIAPAGSIITSVNDQAQWIRLNLNEGKWNGNALFSQEQLHEMWTPHSIEDYSAGAQKLWPGKHFELYGLGWSMYDYYGYKVVSHGGGYDGMISQTILVPELELGFVILTNNINSLPYAMMFRILDEYIQPKEKKDWADLFLQFKKRREANQKAERTQAEADRVKNTSPSLPLEKYAGKYTCNTYGSATVSVVNGALQVQFDHTPIFTGSLKHWHFDTFEITMTKVPSLPAGTCVFMLNEQGTPERMRIDIPNPDFDFTEFDFRRAD
jgi:CubicO group peptidase (beta-lactamase class C family)